MKRGALWQSILSLLMMWSVAASAATPEQLLRRLYEVKERYSYIGRQTTVFIEPEGPRLCRMQIIHQRPSRTLTRYRDSGRVVLQKGRSLLQYEPDARLLLVSEEGRCPRLERGRELQLLLRNYRIESLGREKIIGRTAEKVLLRPRYPGNPSQIYWIDLATGLPLKTEYYSPGGVLQAFACFSEIDFRGKIDPRLLRISIPEGTGKRYMPASREITSLKALESRAGFEIVVPVDLPPGYILTGGTLIHKEPAPAVMLRITDGLNTISIFEEPASRWEPRQMEGCPGKLQQAYRWKNSGLRVTLVGNLSRYHIMALFRSIDADRERRLVRRISKEWGTSPERIGYLRDAGLGFDDIAVLLTLAHRRKHSIESMRQTWLSELWNRDAIIRRFRANKAEMNNLIRKVMRP